MLNEIRNINRILEMCKFRFRLVHWIDPRSIEHNYACWSGNRLSSSAESSSMKHARRNGNVHHRTSQTMMMMMMMMMLHSWNLLCTVWALQLALRFTLLCNARHSLTGYHETVSCTWINSRIRHLSWTRSTALYKAFRRPSTHMPIKLWFGSGRRRKFVSLPDNC